MERVQNSSQLRKPFHEMDLSHSDDVATTIGNHVESSQTDMPYDFYRSIPLYFNFQSPSEINFSTQSFQHSESTITNSSESSQIKTSSKDDIFYEQGRILRDPKRSDTTSTNSAESGLSEVTVINNNVNNNEEDSESKPESSESDELLSKVAKAESLRSIRIFNKHRKTLGARRRPRSISHISYKSPLQTICERESGEKMEEIVSNYNTTTSKQIPENIKMPNIRGLDCHDSPISRLKERSEKKAEDVKSTSDELTLFDLGYSDDVPVTYESKFNLPLKSCMLDIICNKIMNNLHTSFIVHIGGEHFHCHHLVLGSYTRYFDDDMVNMQATIPEDKMTLKTFISIYDWMTFEDNQNRILTTENVLRIFQASKYLNIGDLEEQCWYFVDQELMFSEHTAFNLYIEAMQLKENEIADVMLQRISKIFLTLVASEDFLNLQVEEVCPLLRSSYAVINSEMEVLLSAVRWLWHDWNSRKAHDLDVMSCVRFGSIDPQSLVFIKHSPEFSELVEILKNPEIDRLRCEGLAVSIYTYWPHDDPFSQQHLQNIPEPRIMNETDLPHHDSYKGFLIYLEKVRTSTMNNIPISELDEDNY